MARSLVRFAGAVVILMLFASRGDAFVSSKTFVADCAATSDPVQRAECRGYIAAVADAINSNVVKGRRVCFPPGASQDDVYETVLLWVREHARLLQRIQGFGLVYAALIKSYPCRK